MKEFIEKLIGRLKDNHRAIVTNDEDLEWNRAVYSCTEIVNQLAEEYKDAEEQGLLLRLPCKVGDTVYFVDFDENEYDEAIVESIEFGRNGFLINSDCEIGTYLGAEYLFLTKEEAEQALKQMGE